MASKSKRGLGVPASEQAVGLSATSPQPSASGLSASIPHAALLVLRHAIGLDDSGKAGPQGEFRNHFVTGERSTDFAMCEDLVRLELMTRRRYVLDEMSPSYVYHVTEAGKEVARPKPTPKPLTDGQQ